MPALGDQLYSIVGFNFKNEFPATHISLLAQASMMLILQEHTQGCENLQAGLTR